jgi:hypothetical protein
MIWILFYYLNRSIEKQHLPRQRTRDFANVIELIISLNLNWLFSELLHLSIQNEFKQLIPDPKKICWQWISFRTPLLFSLLLEYNVVHVHHPFALKMQYRFEWMTTASFWIKRRIIFVAELPCIQWNLHKQMLCQVSYPYFLIKEEQFGQFSDY